MATDRNPACPHDVIVTHNGCLECGACGRVLGPAPAALTEADLAAIEHGHSDCRPGYCCCWIRPDGAEAALGEGCDAARLLAEVRRLRALVEHPALGATHIAEDAIVRWTRAD